MATSSEQAYPDPATLVAVHLRCEHKEAPLGIDELQPELSWTLDCADTSARSKAQSAWHILVCSSQDLLEGGQADLWDSGKTSGSNMAVTYAGQDLRERDGRVCFWNVRVWDERGD